MTDVRLPDGSIGRFPDNMSEADIEAVLQREFPAEPQQAAAVQLPQLRGLAAYLSEHGPSRQTVTDLTGQGIGTALGIAAGAPGGPPGMIAGGATGSMAGKSLARRLAGDPQPDAGEMGIDAAAGAAGPVGGVVGRAGKSLVRDLVGGSTKAIKNIAAKDAAAETAWEASRRAAGETATAKAEAQSAGATARAVPSTETQEASLDASVAALKAQGTETKAAKAATTAVARRERAYEAAIREAAGNAGLSTGQVHLLSAAGLVLADPATAVATLAGGHVVRKVHQTAAEYLLGKDWFIRWALDNSGAKKQAVTESLAALGASKALTSEDKTALGELQDALDGGPPQESKPASPLRERLSRDRRADAGTSEDEPAAHAPPRDTMGRFTQRKPLRMGEQYSFDDLVAARRAG